MYFCDRAFFIQHIGYVLLVVFRHGNIHITINRKYLDERVLFLIISINFIDLKNKSSFYRLSNVSFKHMSLEILLAIFVFHLLMSADTAAIEIS
ncbi:hypothetical protein BA724_01555 [Domibacillus iocasae]|uniref:Uncharacterized protein n=1 Tax=Domibacillus iocasae TaxID=1714016 RepID=A0A1E7DR40_9BACI|nr:hypothetical protein BA724_01555 [Domibacillus iocasae]